MAAVRAPMTPDVQDERFVGEIAGVGTRSGTRVVIGRWTDAPVGPFADVMIEERRGSRILLAPTREVAAYVSTVYEFDEVVVGDVRVERAPDRLAVDAPQFELDLRIGGRDLLGRVLHAVPASVGTSPRWAAMVDPLCRLVLRDVRTRTRTAGAEEYYGATDRHRVVGASATWRGIDLGPLGDVSPPVRFGGSSTPRRPSIVAVTTTVRRR